MKTLTVVCPAYNEAEGIRYFYDVLKKELSNIDAYAHTIFFVIDGGTDGTVDILKKIAIQDPRVHILALSRNFGHQVSLLAGIDHADADVVIMMDSDLQHPPAIIPKLIEEYEKGNDIVYTIREESEQRATLRSHVGKLFYRLINTISEVPINENAADFRLISRRVADVIRLNIRERNLFLRGIFSWVGFDQAAVVFTVGKRTMGKSKYSMRKLVQLGIFGIVSFSKKPLRAASVTGLLLALFGFVFAVITTIQYLVGSPFPSGWATVVVLLSIFGGTQLIFLGVLGEYIGAIFDEVKARPHYIVKDTVNIKAVTR